MDVNEDIVISGIAGRFPECHNVEEFKTALLKGEDLMTINDKRFPAGMHGLPKRQGKIPDVDKFDASFFGLHPKQANFTDPRQRILLETVFEAIIDAGYNPSELKGSKTGVVVGLSLFTNFAETVPEDKTGYSILGTSHCSAANRISFCFDLKGPSYAIDTGCSSSLCALSYAVKMLKSGQVEYAIVGGTHLGLHPYESIKYNQLNMLSPEGTCKVFSKERNGFARSEAICAYFLQKKSTSRRIYATILGASTNTNGYVKQGYTYPSSKMQYKLMKELYEESKIDTNDVSYVEMHGTGSVVGDVVECQSMVNMFFGKRNKPLLVGSVKSNMGHGETVSGLAAMTKVLIAMETGIIPANIHMNPIDTDLPGIGDKKLKIVTKNTAWTPGIAGVNSFGFGGANAHVILKAVENSKTKLQNKRKHRLVQVSGRTEESVKYIIDQIHESSEEEEFLSLLDEIHKTNIEGHSFRGYTLLGEKSLYEISNYKSEKRPIWFIYSGMGSHWPGMGRDLMHIEVFQNTINRCAEAVKPYGIDIIDIIMNASPSALEDLGNCFCTIISISIALTELLASLGIKPDFFAGHSLGEVGCAYANGDLTPEQAVLLAYSKNYAVKNSKLPAGQMAVVGLSIKEIKSMLPSDIFVACCNGKSSVTISGPENSVKDFVKNLNNKGIFAKFVYTGGIAFHSKYLEDSDKHLLNFVKKVIPNPKPRLESWVTTSVSAEKMNEKWVAYNGPEYHTNNYLSTVLFDTIYQSIQENAIVIEIGPHSLMQSIIKKELGNDNTIIPLLNKNIQDQEQCLLKSIGKIFIAGEQPNLRKLYKESIFPVSSGTRMLSPLVQWDHSNTWFVPYWKNKDSFGHIVTVNLKDESYLFLKGHNIDGKVIMPATGYLEMVWKARAAMSLKDFNEFPVIFENVLFKTSVVLPDTESVEFLINIMAESGYFEIYTNKLLIVTGNINIFLDSNKEFITSKELFDNDKSDVPNLTKHDFYKEAHLKGYYYLNTFQGVHECDVNGLSGKIEWMDNYVSFLDAMFQLYRLHDTSNSFLIPSKINQVLINPISHIQESKQKYISVTRDPYCNIVQTKAIKISGISFIKLPLIERPQSGLVLESFDFVHYDSSLNDKYDLITSITISLQIIIQNTPGLIKKLVVGEIKENSNNNEEVTKNIKDLLNRQVMTETKYIQLETPEHYTTKYDVLIVNQTTLNFERILSVLKENGFIIFMANIKEIDLGILDIIFKSPCIFLLRRRRNFPVAYDTINIRNSDFKWLEKLKKCTQSSDKKTIYLFTHNDDYSGIIGLQKCLLAEGSKVEFNAVCIHNQNDDIFSIDDEFYREQLSKGLAINILNNNKWGTYVHLTLDEIKQKYCRNASLTMKSLGDFSSFFWLEQLENNMLAETISIHYAALSSKDAAIATAKIVSDRPTKFGTEYSGLTKNNNRVMGIVPNGSVSFEVKGDPHLIWKVPTSWSLEEASTVPIAYTMCYYGMFIKSKVTSNNTILIHNATSDIGIAALNIALNLSAEIFATVASTENLSLLTSHSKLNIINMAIDKSFENLILRRTKGRGVDFILNSSDEGSFQQLLNCLQKGGTYLDITNSKSIKFFNNSNVTIKDCQYLTVKVEDILEETVAIKCQLQNLLQTGIESGLVKPIQSTTFKVSEIESAFKFLSSGHTSKVLIQIKEQQSIEPPKLLSIPQLFFYPNKTYIIIGGLEDIGFELITWLIHKGARKIILNAQNNIWNGYQALCLKRWSQNNAVTIQINLNDTKTTEGAKSLINNAQHLGPIGGIFHAATLLRDANIEDQTVEKFEEVFKTKLVSGQNLDIVTRQLCKHLDHFIVFSTVWSGRGHIGQTNYGMANSALERLCEKRRRDNLPALAVQWGPIEELEFLSTTNSQQKVRKDIFNMAPQQIKSCFETLERFILQEVIVGSSIVLRKRKELSIQANKSAANTVANILGINNLDSVNKAATLSQLGLDSLMLAEVKHSLYRHFDLDIGPEDVRNLTFDYLMNLQVNNRTRPVVTAHFPPPLVSKTPLVNIKHYDTNNGNHIVFMIHPIEGYLHYLLPLAGNLKSAVYGIQSTRESNFDTITETAKYFLKLIKNVQSKGPYYICGYSYGATLGFELGLQLENEGEEVELVALDGAPDYSKYVFKDENDMNKKIMKLFPSLFKEVDLDQAIAILSKYETLEDSILPISQFISKETGIKFEDVKQAALQYFSRCTASFRYQPSQKLNGKVKLIRRLHNPQAKFEDYGYHKICNKPVEVRKLKGDHITILFGENLIKLTELVNKWIDSHATV